MVLNADAAIYSACCAKTIAEGVEMANEAIDSGRAMQKLEDLKRLSNEVR